MNDQSASRHWDKPSDIPSSRPRPSLAQYLRGIIYIEQSWYTDFQEHKSEYNRFLPPRGITLIHGEKGGGNATGLFWGWSLVWYVILGPAWMALGLVIWRNIAWRWRYWHGRGECLRPMGGWFPGCIPESWGEVEDEHEYGGGTWLLVARRLACAFAYLSGDIMD